MSEKFEKFAYTSEGFLEARDWLKQNGFWDESQKGFSTDGWSVVGFANDKYNSINK